MMKKLTKTRVYFTGGGSGGHVIPALTLIKELRQYRHMEIRFIGGYTGIESTLVPHHNISYRAISSGKLRRYFSWENFTDLFRVFRGFLQSLILLGRSRFRRKTIVFSTGGFVSLPVVFAAKFLGITIYIHEQTSRVGLANKLASLVADKVFVSFEDSKKFFPPYKTTFSGYPIRPELFEKTEKKLKLKGYDLSQRTKPLLFVTGGGNGSKLLNDLIKGHLGELKQKYIVIHQVGKKFTDGFLDYEDENYICLGFIGEEMVSLLKQSDIMISRAGAGSVCELLALKKRSILVPLKIAQKNEQYWNAMEAVKKLNSVLLEEDEIKDLDLMKTLEDFESDKSSTLPFIEMKNATKELAQLLSKSN